MKVKRIIPTALLILSAALSAPTFACSTSIDEVGATDREGVLFTQPKLNKNLGCGEYEFASLNSHYNSSFTDRWKFTVAQDVTAAISVFDFEFEFDTNNHSQKSQPKEINTAKILDTKNLSFRLYDDAGNLLGKAYENETLSGLDLEANHWYTLKVSGKVAGLFGSSYYGKLDTCVTPVPLGDTAPMLGSALALLALRLRKRSIGATV